MTGKSPDHFFAQQSPELQACLVALKQIILQQHPGITSVWKYGMPFFMYQQKMLCYVWVHKKLQQPYIGIVEGQRLHHPRLLQEKRAKMKIMLFDPEQDLPLEDIQIVLQQAIALQHQHEAK